MKRTIKCTVRNCESGPEAEVNFYPFPKDVVLRKRWLEALNITENDINKRSKVCSKHFKKTEVLKSGELLPEAVPSINLPLKSTFKIKISKKDNNKEVKVEEVKVKEEKPKMPKKHHSTPPPPTPPPIEVPRARTQVRRAASKEALKQMQLLLDDDDDIVGIRDDDEYLAQLALLQQPSPPPPPKKKYKLSHRKSSDGNDRDVLVLKTITNRNAENTLELDCWVEQLEEVQQNRIQKIQAEEKEIENKLAELISSPQAKVVHKGDLSSIIEISEQVQKAITAAAQPPPPVILNNAAGSQYQLVMDPRLGVIVGAVSQPATVTTPVTSVQPKPLQGKLQVAQNLQQKSIPSTPSSNQSVVVSRTMRTRRGSRTPTPTPSPSQSPTPVRQVHLTKQPVIAVSAPEKRTPPVLPPRTTRMQQQQQQQSPQTRQQQPLTRHQQQQQPLTRQQQPLTRQQPPPTRLQQQQRQQQLPAPAIQQRPPTRTAALGMANIRPAESNVQGGLATGRAPSGSASDAGKKVVVDLTNDDGRSLPDSREISFNKLQGKTYPSLVVVARPHLRIQGDGAGERPKLDAKVKSVLMHPPTKFTEWLIQQGLVKSEQKCSVHPNNQLKLGMYSDVSKFPYSGGYVWISECCPQRFVSVFSGSLFEGSPHPPMVILKLLYHWACQTNIQNVTQWVKVDNLYVKGMYTWLRSVCTVALQSHLKQIGGPGVKVEIGVISLGTTSQDGNQRQVKVEVLGVLESTSKLIRLRAVEPQVDGDRNYKKRFSKILEPVYQWVHPQSIIVADLTVDKQTLHNMGFQNVVQNTSSEYGNNRNVMDYLRRIVPRMFQNTLSLLSRQIIQQFLDELVWREWYGTDALQAFLNLVLHLSEQTRYESGMSLIVRLNKVAQNPFKNWSIPVTSPSPSAQSAVATASGKSTSFTDASPSAAKKARTGRKPPMDRETPKAAPQQSKTTQQQGTTSQQVERPPKSTSPDVPEQMVPLENYYYATIDNYSKTLKVVLSMKCPFCKSVFDNNIQLMNHLFKHAHNVSQDAQLCRYCLTSVPTATDLLKHIATSHPAETKFDSGFVCLICETQYMNPFILGKHMSKEHCPSELPYQCGTCGYRCSNHKQAVDHFYRAHDNGPTIQCPFCLKSTTIFSASRNITQNVNYFIQHLQKHQRKQYAKRCGKCNLWFVQKDVLKDHQMRMHVSQRGKQGLVPWNAPRNGVMVPKSKMDKYPSDADVINFGTLHYSVPKNLKCKECNMPLDDTKHFPSFESCQNCQYSTCCTNAMQEHNAKCSKTGNPVAEDPLPFEMHCICGFSSKDGNQMARHLAICERKSAYPSKARAKAATVTHSMLDVLGLVRKPDEGNSVSRNKATRTKAFKRDEAVVVEEDINKKEKEERASKRKDVDRKDTPEDAAMNTTEKETVVHRAKRRKLEKEPEPQEKNKTEAVKGTSKDKEKDVTSKIKGVATKKAESNKKTGDKNKVQGLLDDTKSNDSITEEKDERKSKRGKKKSVDDVERKSDEALEKEMLQGELSTDHKDASEIGIDEVASSPSSDNEEQEESAQPIEKMDTEENSDQNVNETPQESRKNDEVETVEESEEMDEEQGMEITEDGGAVIAENNDEGDEEVEQIDAEKKLGDPTADEEPNRNINAVDVDDTTKESEDSDKNEDAKELDDEVKQNEAAEEIGDDEPNTSKDVDDTAEKNIDLEENDENTDIVKEADDTATEGVEDNEDEDIDAVKEHNAVEEIEEGKNEDVVEGSEGNIEQPGDGTDAVKETNDTVTDTEETEEKQKDVDDVEAENETTGRSEVTEPAELSDVESGVTNDMTQSDRCIQETDDNTQESQCEGEEEIEEQESGEGIKDVGDEDPIKENACEAENIKDDDAGIVESEDDTKHSLPEEKAEEEEKFIGSTKDSIPDSITETENAMGSEPPQEVTEDESTEIVEKPNSISDDITSDDIQNLISDMVGSDKPSMNFDDAPNMDFGNMAQKQLNMESMECMDKMSDRSEEAVVGNAVTSMETD